MESQQSEPGRKAKDSKGVPRPKNEDLVISDSDDESLPEIECELCSKSFPSLKTFEQHLNSKKHHQRVTKTKLMKKAMQSTSANQEPSSEASDEPDSTELYCEVCDKTISGYVPYLAHLKGSIHAKNLKQNKLKEALKGMPEVCGDENADNVVENDDIFPKPYGRCLTCQKTFSGPQALHQHMKGATHKKKMQQIKTLESLKDDTNAEVDVENQQFFNKCEVCNKSFSGPVPYKIHLKSSVHEKAVKKRQAEEELKDLFSKDSSKLVCKECKKTFTDASSFKLHLDNNSHGKQKVKDEMFGFVSSNADIVAVKAVQNASSEEESDEKGHYQSGNYFLVCKLCHCSFSGPESARSHVESKKHLKAKREKAEIKLLKQKLKEKDIGYKFNDKNDVPQKPEKSSVLKKKSRSTDTTTNLVEPNDEFELI